MPCFWRLRPRIWRNCRVKSDKRSTHLDAKLHQPHAFFIWEWSSVLLSFLLFRARERGMV